MKWRVLAVAVLIMMVALGVVIGDGGVTRDATADILFRTGHVDTGAQSVDAAKGKVAMRTFSLVARNRSHGAGAQLVAKLESAGWKLTRLSPNQWGTTTSLPGQPYLWVNETGQGAVFAYYMRETTTMEHVREFLRLE